MFPLAREQIMPIANCRSSTLTAAAAAVAVVVAVLAYGITLPLPQPTSRRSANHAAVDLLTSFLQHWTNTAEVNHGR
jgi:hypothetical protein